MMKTRHLIGVVGPCAAGKSTLISGLRAHGYQARHIAQEHSFVPDMWQKITNPEILIYLDVSFSGSIARRKLDWSLAEYETQVNRLSHARQHADLYISTDDLTIPQVLQAALDYLRQHSI